MLYKLTMIASREIGVQETGGNNCGKRIREYQSSTSLDPAPWSWCAAFVDWSIREWLKDKEVVAWLGLKNRTADQWRPTTALAYGLTSWAKKRPNTTSIYNEKNRAVSGDIVTFDFSHTGIVLEDCGDHIVTIEGNTNGSGSRDSESGDGVWRKIRKKSLVKDFIRIHPSTAK